jgi:hypothetical protein
MKLQIGYNFIHDGKVALWDAKCAALLIDVQSLDSTKTTGPKLTFSFPPFALPSAIWKRLSNSACRSKQLLSNRPTSVVNPNEVLTPLIT